MWHHLWYWQWVNRIYLTYLSHFEPFWAIKSGLKMTQNETKWCKMTQTDSNRQRWHWHYFFENNHRFNIVSWLMCNVYFRSKYLQLSILVWVLVIDTSFHSETWFCIHLLIGSKERCSRKNRAPKSAYFRNLK